MGRTAAASRVSVSLATIVGAITLAAPAVAQQHLIDGEFGVGTGLEGGDARGDGVEWKRARLRILAGVDLRVDETAGEGWGFRGFVELEQRATLGDEVRYLRWFSPSVGGYVGAIGTMTPETLAGVGVGARFLIPLGSKTSIFLEPSFNALPLGSDVPGDSVLVWALFNAGLRAGF